MQRTARGVGDVLQLLNRARADAARRKIHHAHETGVVVRVLQQAQISQRMLDFGALKKAQPAIDTVGNPGGEQRAFHHPALRVAAVEQRDFLARHAALHQLLDLIDKPLRLGKVVGRLEYPHRLAGTGLSAQVFAEALAVVADQLVGRVQNVAKAAVITLQLDLVRDLEFADKVGHVADTGAAKGVNALVIVADSDHRAAQHRRVARHRRVAGRSGVVALPGQHLDPGVLQFIRVLKLVNQDVAETPLVMLAHGGVVPQQLVAAQHQLAEIDHAFTLALLLVEVVNFGLFAAVLVMRGNVFGAQAVFLAAADKPHQVLGRKTLVVDLELFAQALDG